MRFLFCNIAWMSYYKGNVNGNDEPKGGGSYVLETKDAHEKHNFQALNFEFSDDSFAAASIVWDLLRQNRQMEPMQTN